MWGLFFVTVAVVAVTLFAPGYLVLRACSVVRTLSLSFAPLVGVAAFVLLGVVYEKFGIWSSWASQAGVLILLAAIFFAVARWRRGDIKPTVAFGLSNHGKLCGCVRFDAVCLSGYLIFGAAFTGVLFLWYLGSPDSYAQEYDNISHLGSIQAFVSSGVWSPFSASLYSADYDAIINPLPGGGFYPTAWYSVAALAVTSMGVSVPCAENVANFIFIAMVLPASVFGFMRVLFDGNRFVIPFGAICTLLFAGFPWMIIFFGPLYPNLSAFCMVPAAAAVFVLLFRGYCSNLQRVGLVVLFVVALVSLAMAQPNSVFTLALLLAPFCVWRISRIPLSWCASSNVLLVLRVGFGILAAVLIAAIWMILYNAPFLAAVVQHTWPPYTDVTEALQNVLVGGFMADGSQIVLAALVAVGVIRTMWDRRYLWISISYLLACTVFIINESSDGLLKHIVAGFWYTDPWRCAAMTSLIGIFLASFGLWAMWEGSLRAIRRLRKNLPGNFARVGVGVVLACATILSSTFPGIVPPGSQSGAVAFRSVLSGLHTGATLSRVYDDGEKAFAQKVKSVIPYESLIINVPDDGSAFAFAADGLRTYYRYTREYDIPAEAPDSRIIRKSLSAIADNSYVQEAVRDIGAQYVLQLDQGEPDIESPHLFTYEKGEKWRGIDSIRDDTPGFEVVLAEGDMRLYKITAV